MGCAKNDAVPPYQVLASAPGRTLDKVPAKELLTQGALSTASQCRTHRRGSVVDSSIKETVHADRFSDALRTKGLVVDRKVLSSIVLLFLLMDGVTKPMMIQPVIDATTQIGYPQELIRPIGFIALACAILYAIPRTAILGAILTTGLLGGAIASKMRLEEPLFSQVLFGVYVGIMVWGGLVLRDGRLRALILSNRATAP
jgi:hypothetical protein